MKQSAQNKAQLFLEVLIAIAVLSVILVGLLSLVSYAPRLLRSSARASAFPLVQKEYVYAAKQLMYAMDTVDALTIGTVYSFRVTTTGYTITTGKESLSISNQPFSRFFTVASYGSSGLLKKITIIATTTNASSTVDIVIGRVRSGEAGQGFWNTAYSGVPVFYFKDLYSSFYGLRTGSTLRIR